VKRPVSAFGAPDSALAWRLDAPLAVDSAGLYLEPEALLNHFHGFNRETVLTVRFRRGGERFRPAPSAHSQPLKQLFQQWRVPVRERSRIPLVYRGDELVVIWGYAVAEAEREAPNGPADITKGDEP